MCNCVRDFWGRTAIFYNFFCWIIYNKLTQSYDSYTEKTTKNSKTVDLIVICTADNKSNNNNTSVMEYIYIYTKKQQHKLHNRDRKKWTQLSTVKPQNNTKKWWQQQYNTPTFSLPTRYKNLADNIISRLQPFNNMTNSLQWFIFMLYLFAELLTVTSIHKQQVYRPISRNDKPLLPARDCCSMINMGALCRMQFKRQCRRQTDIINA